MSVLLPDWNPEKVVVLAPDVAAAKRSKKLAVPAKWARLGHDSYSAWGEYQGSGSQPYEVKIDLLKLQNGEAALHCSCPSRVQPCKHGIGLLFIVVETPEAFERGEAPAYVQAWLDRAAQKARKQATKKKEGVQALPDPEQQTRTLRERQEKITAGLQELELWLEHLIRYGLAAPQVQQYAFWEARAKRMVDAQAPGIADWLRAMASIPARGADWLGLLLDQLSRLYLLIQAFKRFSSLSEAAQADIRAVLGWPLRKEEVRVGDTMRDQWLVLGRYQEALDSRLRAQRIWLRGRQNGHDALILEFAYGDAPFDSHLLPGWLVEAELAFFPGVYPLRAFIQQRYGEAGRAQAMPGVTIEAGIVAYSQALACNPWLLHFPILLDAVVPVRSNGRWLLREASGAYLPVASHFTHKWSLLAVGGGHPIQLAGEWNGGEFLPTSAVVDGRSVDFALLEAL